MLAKLLTGYGAIVASFAVLQGLAPNGKLYWISGPDPEQGGSIFQRERALADGVRTGTTSDCNLRGGGSDVGLA